MLLADAIRLALVSALALLMLTGSMALWVLYPVSLTFGLLSAFSMPAAGSIVPTLVGRHNLQTANSLFQSLSQFAALVGPALAGIVISALNAPASVSSGDSGPTLGIVLAFGMYAVGLVVSVITLALMRLPPRASTATAHSDSNWLESITAGLGYAWRDPLLRILVAVLLSLNLLLIGPLAVGMPVLAKLRLPEGAAALGFLAAGYGGGNLLGTVLASIYQRARRLGVMLTAVVFGFGAGLCIIGWTSSTGLAFLVLLTVGIGNGYLAIVVRTMLHRRTPRELLGRVMSVYFFAKAALVPISQAATGAIIGVSLEALFLGAGVVLVLLAAGLALSPAPRLFELEVEETQLASGATTSEL